MSGSLSKASVALVVGIVAVVSGDSTTEPKRETDSLLIDMLVARDDSDGDDDNDEDDVCIQCCLLLSKHS